MSPTQIVFFSSLHHTLVSLKKNHQCSGDSLVAMLSKKPFWLSFLDGIASSPPKVFLHLEVATFYTLFLDEKLREIGRKAEENGTRVVEMTAGQSLREADGEFSITCLAPETGAGIEPGNAASLVLDVRYGKFGMLLTGDVEGTGEEKLLESGRLAACPVLKAAHHGSEKSGSEEFLETVRPLAAVISAGIGNRYGHPHPETLERLRKIGCSIYTTQECGAVTIRSDGRSMTLERFIPEEERDGV